MYQDPNLYGITKDLQEEKTLEISILGQCKFFGDSDILADKPGGDKKQQDDEAGESGREPYTVVTASSCEIIHLSREAFCEFLSGGGKPIDQDDLSTFIKCQQYYPDDVKIKQKYFEENNWQGFKNELGKAYTAMRSTPMPKKPLQTKEWKYSPTKGFN